MRLSRLFALAALVLLGRGVASAEEARVTVLHTADLHGALTAYDYLADRPAARGLTRLATSIEAMRGENPSTLLLDAGDALQGSALATVYQRGDRARPEPMMAAMNRMRFDAMAVGNHEFSFGLPALGRAREAAQFPWLAANIVRADDGSPAFRGSLVKTFGSLRIGVVGLCTPAVPFLEDSAHWAGLSFLSPIDAAKREVARLRGEERCDAVVVVAHTGLEPAGAGAPPSPDENWGRRIATEVAGIDVLILGHTHSVIGSSEIGAALVSQAGKWGETLGRVDLVFSRPDGAARWRLASRRGRAMATADSTREDSTLAAFAEPYHRETQAALSEVIATASREVNSPSGRFADGPVWDLIHRVQLEASGAEVSLAALEPAARFARGPVTVRDVIRMLPYENTLAAVELTGAELARTLEHSARYLARYTFEADRPLAEPGMPGYNFDAAEGVDYEIDLTRPPGERITGLSFRGAPLAPDARVRVAVNSYRAAGGGGFEAIQRAPRTWRTTRDVRDLVIEHLKRVKTLDPVTHANWRLLPDYATAPERPMVDLLVRQGALRRDEALRIEIDRPATRAALARWLASAFNWSERRPSGAFGDLPDSLAPWFDALLKRHVFGEAAARDNIRPFGIVRLPLALDWCERAARAAGYALAPRRDRVFQEGLLAGLSGNRGRTGERPDTLTRGQALGLVANLRYPTLQILETTDFHGAILSNARERRSDRRVGGSAVLASHLARLRERNPHGTVLLDGGDCFQGTMISNLQFGRPVVEQMNALGYNAMAIGNHEFDWSADTLMRRVAGMRFAALGANMRERKSGKMPRWVRADTLFTRRGVRLGVLGLCYRNTPSVTLARHVAHLRFEDDSIAAVRSVVKLRPRAAVVIGVGHVPAESDSSRRALSGDLPRLARGVRGVDLWLGGHSHNQVIDRIEGVPLMIAGSHGQCIAVCDLVVDGVKKRVIESRTQLVQTYADEVEPDSAMAARVERWNASVAPIASKPVGRNARALFRNRGGESTVGNLVTDAIREAARADIALQNSGGLRADLPEGPVTKASIYEILPFDNVVFTLRLTGAEVRRGLEQALRFGRVTQVSGIRYAYDSSRPEMQRVVSLTDATGDSLLDDRLYKVACNDFMATGGDNYDVLSGGQERTNTGIVLRDVLETFVAERSKDGRALEYASDGRIRRVGNRGASRGE